jgi:hypothetical protein
MKEWDVWVRAWCAAAPKFFWRTPEEAADRAVREFRTRFGTSQFAGSIPHKEGCDFLLGGNCTCTKPEPPPGPPNEKLSMWQDV